MKTICLSLVLVLGSLLTCPAQATTPQVAGAQSSDLTGWETWWYFNRDGLLDLRRRFNDVGQITGAAAGMVGSTRPSDTILREKVVPTLLELTGEKSQDLQRASAGFGMSRIGDFEDAPMLATLDAMARERDPGLRATSVLALGLLGNEHGIEHLGAILEGDKAARGLLGYTPNESLRAHAALALGTLSQRAENDDVRRTALRPLWKALMDTGSLRDRDLRVALVNAVSLVQIDFGKDSVDQQADGAQVPQFRRQLIRSLWQQYGDERDPVVRGHFPIALARLLRDAPDDLRSDGIERLLERFDKRPKTNEEHALIIALGEIGNAWGHAADTQLREALYTHATKQKDHHARHLALIAIAQVAANSQTAVPPTSVQDELEDFLLERFKHAPSNDAPWIAMAAGNFGARLQDGSVNEPLLKELRTILLKTGSAELASASALALGLCQDQAASEAITDALDKRKNPNFRGIAALGLGLLRHKPSFEVVIGMLQRLRYDPIATERASIGAALINRQQTAAILRERLIGAPTGVVAIPIATALGRVSDSSSIALLLAIASDKRQLLETRAAATSALGAISSRSPITWRHALATNVNYMAWTPALFDPTGAGVLNIF